MSSRKDRKKNSRAIWGRKESTPPTPAMMPSQIRLTSTWDTPAPSRVSSSAAEHVSMPAATRLDSQEPKGPKVMTNITSMAHRNRGRARYFPVTTLSTFSLRVSSPGFCPLVTEAATTRSMYW